MASQNSTINPTATSGIKVIFIDGSSTSRKENSNFDLLNENTDFASIESLSLSNYSINDNNTNNKKDDWPLILAKVKDADILVFNTSARFGEISSTTKLFFERIYSSGTLVDGSLKGKIGWCNVSARKSEDNEKLTALNCALEQLGYRLPKIPKAEINLELDILLKRLALYYQISMAA